MQTIEIKKDIEFEKKVLLCIYWTARKAVTTEGCAPFYFKKIATPSKIYRPNPRKLLKLSPELISTIQKELEDYKHLEIEMNIGNENLNANFKNNDFSISTTENKELEIEIADKINEQFKKKYPRTCPQFIRRVYKNWN